MNTISLLAALIAVQQQPMETSVPYGSQPYDFRGLALGTSYTDWQSRPDSRGYGCSTSWTPGSSVALISARQRQAGGIRCERAVFHIEDIMATDQVLLFGPSEDGEEARLYSIAFSLRNISVGPERMNRIADGIRQKFGAPEVASGSLKWSQECQEITISIIQKITYVDHCSESAFQDRMNAIPDGPPVGM